MKILVKKNGQIIGPLSEEETVRRFHTGEFDESDLAMVEGATGWHELGSYIVEEPVTEAPRRADEQIRQNETSTPCEIASSSVPPPLPRSKTAKKSPWPRPLRVGLALAALTLLTLLGLNLSAPLKNGLSLLSGTTAGKPSADATKPVETSQSLPEQTTTQTEKPALLFEPQPHAVPLDAPATPTPRAMANEAAGTHGGEQSLRVVLQRDTTLLFRNEPFRKGTAGEEFQVLATRADIGRIYVKEVDAAGNVIALSLPAELVAPVNGATDALPPPPPQTSTAQKTAMEQQANGAGGRAPAQGKPNLSMDVKTIATGGKVRSRNGAVINQGWDYANGRQLKSEQYWSTRDRESRVGLSIQVHNFSKLPQELRIESFFVGTPVAGTRTPLLVSVDVGDHKVEAGDRLSTEAFSEVARSSTRRDFSTRTNPDPSGFSSRVWSAGENTQGTKVSGWIVRLSAGGQVVQVRASSPSLQNLAKDPAALDQLAGKARPEPVR